MLTCILLFIEQAEKKSNQNECPAKKGALQEMIAILQKIIIS